MLAQHPYEVVEEQRRVSTDEFYAFMKECAEGRTLLGPDCELIRFELTYKDGQMKARCLYRHTAVESRPSEFEIDWLKNPSTTILPPPLESEEIEVIEREPVTERSPVLAEAPSF